MCIDALETTTNSNSSDSGIDTRKHLFSKNERMLLYFVLNFRILSAVKRIFLVTVPKSSAEIRRYLSTILRKDKVSGNKNSKVITEMMRKEIKWKENSKRPEATLIACMDDYGMNGDSNLSHLSHNVCIYQRRQSIKREDPTNIERCFGWLHFLWSVRMCSRWCLNSNKKAFWSLHLKNCFAHADHLSHVMWCAMSEDDDARLNKTRRQRAHSLVRCLVSCALCWSWLSRRHWCRTSYRAVSPRMRNSKFLLNVVVGLHVVIVNSKCSHDYCLLHIAKQFIEMLYFQYEERNGNAWIPVSFVQSIADSSFHSILIPFAQKPVDWTSAC